jgi:(S)-sulfolactate dehydrogenase
MAAKAKAMGMEVRAYDAVLPEAAPAWSGAERTDLDNLISEADVITLHCPLTPETRGMIGSAELARMKRGAILINSARGGIVDETACASALKSGHLGGAALDTLETEPINAATGALFAGIENVILTPHIAGVTQDANKRISNIAVTNVRRVLGTPS